MYGAYHHVTVMGREDAPCDHSMINMTVFVKTTINLLQTARFPRLDTGDLVVLLTFMAQIFHGLKYNGKPVPAECQRSDSSGNTAT